MSRSTHNSQKRERKPSFGDLEKNDLKTEKKQTFGLRGAVALPTLYLFAFVMCVILI
jgi:hypothetical protein